MDKDEAILTLRKNKLEMEHQALLQDREVILITEAGFPITITNVIVSAGWYTYPVLFVPIVIFAAIVMGIIEGFRRRKSREIRNKQREIDDFHFEGFSPVITGPMIPKVSKFHPHPPNSDNDLL